MGKDIELAILFADVVGSTRIYEVMGDLRARDMVLTCVEIMRSATEQNHGTVIKTIGDEIMATFPTPNDAVNAASRMQHDIRTHSGLKVEGQPIAIRIGGHFGPVVLENRDIFGAAVHTANRMTSQAKAGQVMITSAMVELLAPEWRSAVRQIDVATLKGKTSEDELFEVLWQKEDATSMLPAIALSAAVSREKQRPRRLHLKFLGQDLLVDDARSNITIGRAEENDVVVKGNLISRLHARIEFSRGKFLLVDQSTNGTFVTTKEGEEAFVRRDSMQLKGEGMIGFGRVPENGSPLTLRYACEE
ncbi:MAG TPA: adenylate/guanylate cyclase domain-containing protein [Povalibacter sp.]|uniref:adenylate/guanylate cyclase domain-containing protein n=1 Tax=Povalibacter sp. TaxID=1962978 RepID=UPI002D17E66B|nr:adenylate/guanylate cyclase domain-containing protein [Povalibacter sp.]HMN44642.1 adenylate/guanylate cyclase domain-containing protein [Povalibacter sp.]